MINLNAIPFKKFFDRHMKRYALQDPRPFEVHRFPPIRIFGVYDAVDPWEQTIEKRAYEPYHIFEDYSVKFAQADLYCAAKPYEITAPSTHAAFWEIYNQILYHQCIDTKNAFFVRIEPRVWALFTPDMMQYYYKQGPYLPKLNPVDYMQLNLDLQGIELYPTVYQRLVDCKPLMVFKINKLKPGVRCEVRSLKGRKSDFTRKMQSYFRPYRRFEATSQRYA